jgi:hypothetical protein
VVKVAIDIMIKGLEQAGFFAYVLPFLLTLAVTYGILEHYDMPRSKSARAVISLMLAFMVLPTAGLIAPFLYGVAKGLVVVAAGILMAVIFVEILGYKAGGKQNIFEAHPRSFGIILIFIAALVFIAAGGLGLLGINIPRLVMPRISEDLLAMFFFLAVIALGIWWIAAKEGK